MVSREMIIGCALLAGYFLGRGSALCNLCIVVFVVYIFMREQTAARRPCMECGTGRYIPFQDVPSAPAAPTATPSPPPATPPAKIALGANPAQDKPAAVTAPDAAKPVPPAAVQESSSSCPEYDVPLGGICSYLSEKALTQTPSEKANRVDVTTSPAVMAKNRTEFYKSLVDTNALQEPQNPGMYELSALS
jgi:hypothetical protein